MKRFLLSLAAVACMAVPAKAAVETFEFDTTHTQVIFFVSHLGFSMSEGEFLDFDGEINFDTENPADSSVNVTIQTASIDMDDEKWDAHMKNEDFFNVEKYPTMTFKSTAVNVTGDNTADITGDLTILDVTKPVVLHVTHNKTAPHPFSGKTIAGFSATANIKRSEFGMNYGLPNVGDVVEIRIEVDAVQVSADEGEERDQ